MTSVYNTQNDLLMGKLQKFYSDPSRLEVMLGIINGDSNVSLRIVDWFATNYAKKNYTILPPPTAGAERFKVYDDYKLHLKAYTKRRFDPFCRHERINIPYKEGQLVQTTIGQLNFFKWAIENGVIEFIERNHGVIEKDMNSRNSTSRRKTHVTSNSGNKTRKRREELSLSATKSVKKEHVEIIVRFD